MGASAQRPTSGTPGAGGSGFYQNALNQQKQAVANVPATQGGNDQTQAAYNQYMQQQKERLGMFGRGIAGAGQAAAEQVADNDARQRERLGMFGRGIAGAGQAAAEQEAMRRRAASQQPPSSPKGITMGAGYANRPFG